MIRRHKVSLEDPEVRGGTVMPSRLPSSSLPTCSLEQLWFPNAVVTTTVLHDESMPIWIQLGFWSGMTRHGWPTTNTNRYHGPSDTKN